MIRNLVISWACCGAAIAQSQDTVEDPCKAQKAEIAKLEQWVSYDRQHQNASLTTNQAKLAAAAESVRQCNASAVALYQEACDSGRPIGCFNLGIAYMNGEGELAKDLVRALALFQKACDGGNAHGCTNLGFAYEGGTEGIPKDLGKAAALYQKACDGGDVDGCFNLGTAYARGGDLDRAVTLFKKACDGGSAPGCFDLGTSYAGGTGGLPRNLVRAVALFKKSCDAGFAPGCARLGIAYAYSEGGLRKDLVQAVALFKKGCDGGSASGCTNLGIAYENGTGGLPRDLDRAAALYQEACDGGDSSGCTHLRQHAEPSVTETVKRAPPTLDTSSGLPQAITERTLNVRPPYYKGPMPLRYTAAEVIIPGVTSVVLTMWHQFNGWTNKFQNQTVQAVDAGGRVLAGAKLLDVQSGHRARFRETHYSPSGQVLFECTSIFEAQSGDNAFKIAETDARGVKGTEYFFLLPNSAMY